MMNTNRQISRRDFLKTISASLAAFGLPALVRRDFGIPLARPRLNFDDLPDRIRKILSCLPFTYIDQRGLLYVRETGSNSLQQVPLARTQWNLEFDHTWDRLVAKAPWGIVLHWYGDKDSYDRSIEGYLRGFDSLRSEDGQMIRTSAHFVVGSTDPGSAQGLSGEQIGYLQTQLPDLDGTPFIGSHLGPLDYVGYNAGQHYFVKALDRLSHEKPGRWHLLQEMYQGDQIDPNFRTIGIEIAGYDFDSQENYPEDQKIASVVALVLALMRRYNLPANSIVGHHELQLGKADPGKQFLALIRFLIGVKALLDDDPLLWDLVFGSVDPFGLDPVSVVYNYFQLVRDYLVLTASPLFIYEWEASSAYWWLIDMLPGMQSGMLASLGFFLPVASEITRLGDTFLKPGGHEGIDLYCGAVDPWGTQQAHVVQLIANGQCLFVGDSKEYHGGRRAIFRHRQSDGAEIISIYGHLESLQPLSAGRIYPAGTRIGHIGNSDLAQQPFLHFALGYAASWETYLKDRPSVPLNAGQAWVQQRFIDPQKYNYHRYDIGKPDATPMALFE